MATSEDLSLHRTALAEQEEPRCSLKMNLQRDLPLLLTVRNATFISHEQLLKIQIEAGLEHNPRCFHWRLRRFLDAGLIRALGTVPPYLGRVYAITRFGLGVLESYGEGLMTISSSSQHLPSVVQAPHFLELNEIRKALKDTGKLLKWRWERELTSLNCVIGAPLLKEYDAIAELDLGGEPYCVAIEYERTLKSSARYRDIQKAIRDEGGVDMILYLTATVDQVFSLAGEFGKPGIPMCFASSRKFQALKFSVLCLFAFGTMRDTYSLNEALNISLPLRD
jgi:hypothetical protein